VSDGVIECGLCGRKGLTWADVRFGHPRPGETGTARTCSPSRPAISTRSFDARTGYQPFLARYPGDPTAVVDSPRGAKRLEDQRLREGWVDRKDAGPDKRAPRAGPSELAKKWAPAIAQALRENTTAPLERIGDRPEDAT